MPISEAESLHSGDAGESLGVEPYVKPEDGREVI